MHCLKVTKDYSLCFDEQMRWSGKKLMDKSVLVLLVDSRLLSPQPVTSRLVSDASKYAVGADLSRVVDYAFKPLYYEFVENFHWP